MASQLTFRRPFFGAAHARDETTAQVLLLMQLRWIAIAAQVACVYIGVHFEFIEPGFEFLFWSVAGLLTVFNLVTARRLALAHRFARIELFLQLVFDLAALSMLLFFSGGLWNPFFTLLYLHAVLGAWFLRERMLGLVFLAVVGIAFGGLGLVPALPRALRAGSLPRPMLYAAYGLVGVVLWIVTRWTLKDLGSLRVRVESLREQSLRMDNLRALGAVTAGFAHEFATPLNTVRMRLERARSARISEGASEELDDSDREGPFRNFDLDLDVALEAVAQCEQTLRSLTQARLGSPESLSLKPLGVRELLNQVVASWRTLHPDARLEWDAAGNTESGSDARVLAPRLALVQSILSLLDNARQSAPAGRAAETTLRLRSDRESVTIEIEDTGTGFPEVVLEKVGEPFLTVRPGGTGLGLYNALTLVEGLGGNMVIENRMDRPDRTGARARLQLPRYGIKEGGEVGLDQTESREHRKNDP